MWTQLPNGKWFTRPWNLDEVLSALRGGAWFNDARSYCFDSSHTKGVAFRGSAEAANIARHNARRVAPSKVVVEELDAGFDAEFQALMDEINATLG
jgi:hypothetical protein